MPMNEFQKARSHSVVKPIVQHSARRAQRNRIFQTTKFYKCSKTFERSKQPEGPCRSTLGRQLILHQYYSAASCARRVRNGVKAKRHMHITGISSKSKNVLRGNNVSDTLRSNKQMIPLRTLTEDVRFKEMRINKRNNRFKCT